MTKQFWMVAALMILASGARAVEGRPDVTCTGSMGVEQATLATTEATPLVGISSTTPYFQIIDSSGTYSARQIKVKLFNMDGTAANQVWLSTFQVTATVSGVLDTSKSWPLAGAANETLEIGAQIRLWAHRVISSSAKLIVRSCN